MKTLLSATLATLMLAAVPAQAQTLGTLLPALTWPDDTVTGSTKGCDSAATTVCTLQE
jgi:hypothetical protein